MNDYTENKGTGKRAAGRRLAFASLVFGLLALLTACGMLALALLRNTEGGAVALLLALALLLGVAGCWLIVLILKRGQS